jgi:hypothetical protein
MLRNKLVRSDGSVIDSSVIISCEFTEDVNCSTNLSLGDVTSSELFVEIRSTEAIRQGEVFTYYMIEDGVETLIGEFNAEKPTVASRSSIRFSAYDNISKTEKQFSDWLRDNQSLFPMTPRDLVLHTCSYCGVTYAGGEFPNQDIEINAFYADGITGRQVLSWVAALAGRFVRANAQGEIEFAWYKPAPLLAVTPGDHAVSNNLDIADDGRGNISIVSDDLTITDDGDGNVVVEIANAVIEAKDGNVTISTLAIPYVSGGLSYETYTTDLIQRVQIKHSDDDIGVLYPQDAEGNCFSISGNMVLGACSADDVALVAEHLFEQLRSVSYVPVNIRTFRTIRVRAGDILVVRDSYGNRMTTYVMKVSVSPSGTTIASTGDKSYGSNAAVASEKYSNLTGKVLELSKTVDGLKITNRDLEGKVSSLELSTEAFKTSVSDTYVTGDEFADYQETVATSFEQTAEGFDFKFKETTEAIGAVDKDLQDKYNERTSYIRFEDGNIILGRSGSEILLIQKNDRISFVRNVKDHPEVAWFADDVLHVTEGEFTVQLGIGKFGFKPGPHGNLSFKKVVD